MQRFSRHQITTGVAIVLLVCIVLCFYIYHNDGVQYWTQSDNNLKVASDARQSIKTSPIPEDSVLNKMSLLKLIDFFHGYIHSTQALCDRRVRMGRVGDGGWDICDDSRFKPDPKNCLVYSFGISDDTSFDDSIQNYGCEVHSYDPSLGDKDPSIGKKFTFHKIGIGHKNEINSMGWTLQTLGKTREMNGHSKSKRRLDIVKMDVEGSELYSLSAALTEGSLDDIRQLAFEIHIETEANHPRKDYILLVITFFEAIIGCMRLLRS